MTSTRLAEPMRPAESALIAETMARANGAAGATGGLTKPGSTKPGLIESSAAESIGVCVVGIHAWPLPAWLDTLCGAGVVGFIQTLARLAPTTVGAASMLVWGVTAVGAVWLAFGWWRQQVAGKFATVTLIALMVALVAVLDAKSLGAAAGWPMWVWLLPLWLLLVATSAAAMPRKSRPHSPASPASPRGSTAAPLTEFADRSGFSP